MGRAGQRIRKGLAGLTVSAGLTGRQGLTVSAGLTGRQGLKVYAGLTGRQGLAGRVYAGLEVPGRLGVPIRRGGRAG